MVLERRPRRRMSATVLLVSGAAAVLTACSGPTPLCDQAAPLIEQAQLAQAAELYARAEQAGEGGCAEDGLSTVGRRYQQAFTEAARGSTAEQAGDVAGATAAYEAALAVDAGNQAAATGLVRLGQPAPAPPPPLPQPAPAPPGPAAPVVSWWGGPWPFAIGGALFALLLSGLVLLLDVRRTRREHTAVGELLGGVAEVTDQADKEAEERNRGRFLWMQERLREQRADVDRLHRVLDRMIRSRPTEAADARRFFAAPDGRPDGGWPAVGVVLEVFAATEAAENGASHRLLLRRVLSAEPPEASWAPDADEAAGEYLFEPDWPWLEEYWVTPTRPTLAALLGDLDNLDGRWLPLLLGRAPWDDDALSVTPPSDELLSRIRPAVARSVPSPALDLRPLVEVGGIVLGLGSGYPMLTDAGVTSRSSDLLGDVAAESVSAELGRELRALDEGDRSSARLDA